MRGLSQSLSDETVDRAFDFLTSEPSLALAVSGGGDSMALLRIAQGWAARHRINLTALTVDHGLRPDSAAEARQVSEWCAALGIHHSILSWQRADAPGNLQQAAREARYRLMACYCDANGIGALAAAHTLDDQAETVLMRLARGSGVDGLAAMAQETRIWGLRLFRPLLEFSRGTLREYLRCLGQDWIEDPTNDDPAYDRVKARQALETLAPLGLTADRLSRTARMMRLAREALDQQARSVMQEAVDASPMCYANIDPSVLASIPREIALRVFSEVLNGVSGALYRPRLDPLENALDWALAGRGDGRTLHGCMIRRRNGGILVVREPNACADRAQTGTAIWDGRFTVEPSADNGIVAALGEAGLHQLSKENVVMSDGWTTAPRDARLTTPALWDGDKLLSAPFVPWTAPGTPAIKARALWFVIGAESG